MNILSINRDKWTDKYILELEDGNKIKVSIDILVKHKLKQDMDINPSQLYEVVTEESKIEAYNKALDIISFKDSTSFEIKNKLSKRGYSDDVIEYVIEKLSNYNFINDEKYAQNQLKYLEKYKKQGKNKIMYSLKQKGVSKDILENLEFNEEIEYESAKSLFEKKLKQLENDPKKKEKIYRYLASRGFTNSIVLKLIKDIDKC
ncbi:MAG: regulatory protein RecX [Clostridium sp.]